MAIGKKEVDKKLRRMKSHRVQHFFISCKRNFSKQKKLLKPKLIGRAANFFSGQNFCFVFRNPQLFLCQMNSTIQNKDLGSML